MSGSMLINAKQFRWSCDMDDRFGVFRNFRRENDLSPEQLLTIKEARRDRCEELPRHSEIVKYCLNTISFQQPVLLSRSKCLTFTLSTSFILKPTHTKPMG